MWHVDQSTHRIVMYARQDGRLFSESVQDVQLTARVVIKPVLEDVTSVTLVLHWLMGLASHVRLTALNVTYLVLESVIRTAVQ